MEKIPQVPRSTFSGTGPRKVTKIEGVGFLKGARQRSVVSTFGRDIMGSNSRASGYLHRIALDFFSWGFSSWRRALFCLRMLVEFRSFGWRMNCPCRFGLAKILRVGLSDSSFRITW